MRRELLLVHEMIEAATRVRSIIGDRDAADLFADRDRREALLWNYTVLGEASSQVPTEVKTAHPQVEWAMAVRLRNRIVHGYWEIDLETLHATAAEDLPGMIESLAAVLAALESPRPTDEQIQAWADEAEAGYDVEELPQSAQSPQEIEEQP
jgi:uncharacterized protein with HEPN domain